jgi:hypothetical protein
VVLIVAYSCAAEQERKQVVVVVCWVVVCGMWYVVCAGMVLVFLVSCPLAL